VEGKDEIQKTDVGCGTDTVCHGSNRHGQQHMVCRWGERKRQQRLQVTQTACQTIGYAVGLASSDDSVLLARAIYTENLTINFNLRLAGSGATRSIIDGGGNARVVSILSTTAPDPAAIFRNSRRFTSNVDMDHSRCLW
jgi:hypothetical protein